MSGFVSVATSAARFQDISLNPQNLAGQCAKLKCCINFEVNTYVEAIRQLPPKDVHLETKDATYYYFKADALKREIIYSTERNAPVNTVTLTAAQAFEIIALNKQGIKPDNLKEEAEGSANASPFGDLLNQDAINRFDKKKKKKKKKSGDKQAQAAKGDKPAPAAPKGDRPEKQGRPDRPDRPKDGGGRPDRPKDGPGRPDRLDRGDRGDRRPRQGKPKRPQHPNRGHQGQPKPDAE